MVKQWTLVGKQKRRTTENQQGGPAVVTPLQATHRKIFSQYSLLEIESSDDEYPTEPQDDIWDNVMAPTTESTSLGTFLTEIQPVHNPTALDVIAFQQELGMALSLCGNEYGEGVGYSFLVEDLESYRLRIGDDKALKPTKPKRPDPPDLSELGRVQALRIPKDCLARMGQDPKKYKWLPAKITPEVAMKTIHNDVLTRKTARELYAGLTHQLMTTEYTPSRVGPASYFQTMLDLQHQANSLGTAKVDDDQLMMWCLLAFRRSGHDKGTLTKLDEQWEIEAANYTADQVLDKFIQYWKQRLAALYSDEQGTHHTAKLGERLTLLERNFRDEMSQLMDNQEEIATALQASTHRSSQGDMPSVVNTTTSALTTQTELISAFKDGIAAMTTQLRREIQQLGLQAQSTTSRTTLRSHTPKDKEWQQWKYWCYSCGVNLTHDTPQCPENKQRHSHQNHLTATMQDPQGGNTRRDHLWQKWCHPVTYKIHEYPARCKPRRNLPRRQHVRFHDSCHLLKSRSPTGIAPKYAALDSGATDNFMPTTYVGLNHKTEHSRFSVGCANGSTMVSKAQDELAIPNLPPAARGCYKFDEVDIPLVSVPKLCDTGCTVQFDSAGVRVTDPNGSAILKGSRDPISHLYMIPLASTTEDSQYNLRVPTHTTPSLSQPCSPSLPPTLHHGIPSAPVPVPRVITPNQQARSAYEQHTVPKLINFLHAAAGFPTKTTWIQAVERGYFLTCPGLTAEIIYRASDMVLVADSDAAYLVCPEARSRAGGYHYLTNDARTLFNGPILVLAKVIKNVMASAAEAEVAALYMNAQEALPIRQCLIELGHPQPATALKTDNSTAKGILTGTIKQKRSKAIDMRFYWLKDRAEQGQFHIFWEPGKHNLADYPTKHHTGQHHRAVRPIYLYDSETSPKTIQGCIKILSQDRKRSIQRITRGTP